MGSHLDAPEGFDQNGPLLRWKGLRYRHIPAPSRLALSRFASNLERALIEFGPLALDLGPRGYHRASANAGAAPLFGHTVTDKDRYMGFRCGIVGLPNVGKSTLFNALTETQAAQAANYPFCTIEPEHRQCGRARCAAG